jgi:chromobox protein 5
MARDSPVLGSDNENSMNVDQGEKNSNEQDSGAGDGDASEYEIEQIMDAKRGAFPEVHRAFLNHKEETDA